jgi:hypothetical protein
LNEFGGRREASYDSVFSSDYRETMAFNIPNSVGIGDGVESVK